MRLLVTGADGMLAQAVAIEAQLRGHGLVGLTRAQLDVTDAAAVSRTLSEVRPDAVIQCAAYTAVDAAEQDIAACMAVNAEGARNVARACALTDVVFVYPSTDYVFSGEGPHPYRPDDPTAPINAYGRSKRAGELAAAEAERWLVIRTSWLYGSGGSHFVETISRLARQRDHLDVVEDQIGRPTWTRTLARTTVGLLEHGATGTFHVTDGGEPVSWYGFAREILRQQALECSLRPVPTSGFPRPARRPSWSVLDCASTEAVIGRPFARWQLALAEYLTDAVEGRPEVRISADAEQAEPGSARC